MTRIKEIGKFIEFDSRDNIYLEPTVRHNAIKERLFDVIKTYNPGVILKAGLGNGKILMEIAREFKSYLLVVEPSLNIIHDFLQKNKNDERRDQFSCGRNSH